ncbi:hypothetical protein [Streptococcus australis]|uniref:hypothetical protein n=1 Tax=Streptococcus australis TaxID=113107 RepID=UPI0012B994B4|nr:hypothetical protein [Streptococcus australis]MDB8644119.1 hypothetical protein [Streptococcus australis]
MTDQQLNCETNQDKDGMPEESIQQRMGDQGPENPVQPPMAEQGLENPVQPPMTYQGPENPAQPPMTYQGLENPVQPQMADQGPENPAQPSIMEQAPENSVPNRGLLTLVFFVNMGLLMLFIGSAVLMGGWAIVFLFFLGSYLTCYIAATVLLGIGTKTANKTMLFVSVTLYFASMLFAGDPAWLAIQIPSMISTILVLIGTLLL